ncbi:BQ2448_117 [Microbotryum intermedium]|uniref:BQ2448_117 protein n=1 Tax=Microbotryum intermedium TaxID=269621 RepID=A0A238FA82_9BASI|nr:BQ2448_117 [Microbotryum intermedium]
MLTHTLFALLAIASTTVSAAVVPPKLGEFESWVPTSSSNGRVGTQATGSEQFVKPAVPPKNAHQLVDDFTDPVLGKNVSYGPDPVKSKACPKYTDQTITVTVYVRFYYYAATAAELQGKTPGYYGYHSKADAQAAVNRITSYYAKWNPRIKFVLATGTTQTTAGVWYWRFPIAASYMNQVVGKPDGLAEIAIANECRGKLASRPANQNRQLWIYSVNYISGATPAFSYRPVSTSPFTQDGIFIRTEYFEQSSSYPNFYTPTTLTHEAGHWLGLYHTFEGGCAGKNDGTDGDMCRMTPKWPTSNAPISCPRYGTSFASQKNPCNPAATAAEIETGVTNIMSYSYTLCRDRFTSDQMGLAWRTAVNLRKFTAVCGAPA